MQHKLERKGTPVVTSGKARTKELLVTSTSEWVDNIKIDL
jgi:hypothetical protein